MSTVNLYDVLNVSNDATPSEIKLAYKKLVKRWHPDKPTGDSEMFEFITDAYNKLSNEETRSEYDTLYKLSQQSKKDHVSLKKNAENYFKAQESDLNEKSDEELAKEFKQVMRDMDKKRNYKRNKDDKAINPKDMLRRFDDLQMAREQDDIELTHENLFEGGQFDLNKFNAAFDKMHKGPDELIPHSGNPMAYGGFEDGNLGYSSIDNIDDLYAKDDSHMGVEGQTFSRVDFDIGTKNKLTKKDLEGLEGASYTTSHNNVDDKYNKSLEDMLKERRMEDLKYENREMKDFNTDPTCGGYGIFKDLGVTAGSLDWDDDEKDIQKKYQRLLELRRKDM